MSAEPPPAVVAALREELGPLFRRGRIETRLRAGGGRFAVLRSGERQLLAGWTGDGARAAERALEALLERAPVERLLFVGVAGGLSPELEPGALVVATRVEGPDGPAPPPDGALTERALAVPGTVAGTLLSASRVATAPADKARLLRRLNATGPAAVDLETAVWARVAAARGVPYAAVRAVSDAAGESLPLDFHRLRDRRGRVSRWRVAAHVVLRPRLVPELRRLARRVDDGAERLADVVEAVYQTESTWL